MKFDISLRSIVFLAAAATAHGEILLQENFESPDVSTTSTLQFGATIKKGALPDNGRWIGSTAGFGADRKGLIHKSFGDYTAPTGNSQGFYFGYTNSGITTSTAAIAHTLEMGATYSLSFDVARDNNQTQSSYLMELVAFSAGDGDSARTDVRNGICPGTVLASANGTVTTNDMSKHVSFEFQPAQVLHAGQIGKTVGIRFKGNSTNPILDNVVLEVQRPAVADSDGDSLPDAWEFANFGNGNLSHDGTADTDSDTLTDAFEYEADLNPNDEDSDDDGKMDWIGIPGYLAVEQWDNIPGQTLAEFFASPSFYGQASQGYYTSLAKSTTDAGDNYGLRMSGRVIAPYTGEYRFWIAGDGQCELFLSTSKSAFDRRSIARVDSPTAEEQWYLYANQKSHSMFVIPQRDYVSLVAGEEYAIEILMKAGVGTDHVAVAWEYPGQPRQIIPGTYLRSYVPEIGDLDEDGMPDLWESEVGLNPNDNGLTDINQSGYYNIDGDLLRNFEELSYGRHPLTEDDPHGIPQDILLSENFESPNVSTSSALQFGATIDKGELPDNGRWVGSSVGYGADRKGLINKQFGDYTAPAGNNQGYFFGYTNSGLTTSTSAISHTLEMGATYTLSFDVARDNGMAESSYLMQLVAFAPGEGDSARTSVAAGSMPGTVLNSAYGTVTTNDTSKRITIVFEPDSAIHASHVGKSLGVRFIGNSTNPILDNVLLAVKRPAVVDSDGDGLPDAWEILYFSDLAKTGSDDPDHDGLTNLQEYAMGTDPSKIGIDGDSNGIPDDWESANAGAFAVYPPILAARIGRNQTSPATLYLRNDTDAAVDFTAMINGATFPVYSYVDSISGSIPYVWEDISATGTRLEVISNADDASELVSFVAFTFPFYGQNFSQVHVSSNGLLSFEQGNSSYSNLALPNLSAPASIIAAFWDDLNSRDSGDIYYKQESDRLIIQYQEVTRLGSSDTLTFQIVLHADGKIHLRYHTLNGVMTSCSVGFQNSTKLEGVGIVNNAAYLQNAMAVEIRPYSDFLSLQPPSGTVPPHSVQSLTGMFISQGLSPSVYMADVKISDNSTRAVPYQVPARLEVIILPGDDTDMDSIPDLWEIANGLDPNDGSDAALDPDQDGYTNLEEYTFGKNPRVSEDTDEDGMPDGWEYHNGLSLELNDASGDPDEDGLPNIAEFEASTDPNDPDTDDDFMPDGWEVQYNGRSVITSIEGIVAQSLTVILNPNDSSDASLDPDGDGLTNVKEYLNGTRPDLDDSDGDGASDGNEVNSGANPNDGSDGGVPGGPGSGTVVVDIPFAIGGDYAWWEMTIQGQGPTDTRPLKITSNKDAENGLGDYEGETQMIKLHQGNKYRVTMKRMGGVEEDDGTKWYCWSANVGQDPVTNELLPLETTFENVGYYEPGERIEDAAIAYAVSGENQNGKKATWVIDNRKGLFTQHIDDYGHDVVQSLEAFLVPVAVEDNEFATGVDAVSSTADPQDIGYEDKFWIMAPSGNDPDGNACSNEMKFKIPANPSMDLEITYPDGTQAPATPTPGTVTLGAAGGDCDWHGESATTTETPPVEWKIGDPGQTKATVDLPIAVKTMKRRAVKVAVYRVQRANSRAFPSFTVSDTNEIKNQLYKVFARQVNAWFEPDYFDVDLNYDTNNDGKLYFGSAEEGALATAAEFNGTNSSHDIKVIIVDDLEYYRINPLTQQEELLSGHWIEGSNTCIVAFGLRRMKPGTGEMILDTVLADQLGHTMAHEIGHMMLNVGHPDQFADGSGGPAPLQSLSTPSDWGKRLMCSGYWSSVRSNLLVKKEWDLAEEWLKEYPDRREQGGN